MTAPIEFTYRAISAIDPYDLKEYARRRLTFALRRLAPHVRRVTVRFEDLNGPRRGVDSRCAMVLHLADGGMVAAEATTAWPFNSVTLAARRLGAAAQKAVERQRVLARAS